MYRAWLNNMTQKGLKSLVKFRRRALCVSTVVLCAVFASAATAQSSSVVESLGKTTTVQTSEGLSFNLPARPDFSALAGPQLDLPTDSSPSSLMKLDLQLPRCGGGTENCLNQSGTTNLALTDTFNRHSETGLDLSLTPRASMRFNDEVSSTVVGAVIEIGEDLRSGPNFKSNTWYFFAGADAEALTYSPGSIRQITNGEFQLRDQIIVGDAQAGLGYRIGDADVSLSYMRREASTEEYSFKEDAAALSFTWKR